MNRDSVLRKIRAALQMAADTSSPEEAAIAAGQARKLMDKFQITEWDLKSSAPSDFGTARHPTNYQRWNGMLGLAMAKLNDCIVEIETGKFGLTSCVFKGYLVDAVTAKELYLYLLAQAELQSAKIKGRKAPFLEGFAAGVQEQVRQIMKDREKLQTSSGTALVPLKMGLVTEKFGLQRTSRHRASTNENYSKGYNVGKSTNLSRQVSGQTQKRLGQ